MCIRDSYNTVYVGMDVHKESFSLCAYTIEAEKASHYQRTEAAVSYTHLDVYKRQAYGRYCFVF